MHCIVNNQNMGVVLRNVSTNHLHNLSTYFEHVGLVIIKMGFKIIYHLLILWC